MQSKPAASRNVPGLLVLFVALTLTGFGAGCGDFWQAPAGTTSTGGTGTTGIATNTALTESSTSVAAGGSVSFTASVSAAAATGMVTFYSGGTSLGAVPLTSGTATLTTSFTTAGMFSITADYSGDSTYAASVSASQTLTVTANAGVTFTNISVDASDMAPGMGNRVTLTATVSPSDATGKIVFYEISPFSIHPLGTATIFSGTASVPAVFTSIGTHQVMAAYAGSGDYAASVAPGALRVMINQ